MNTKCIGVVLLSLLCQASILQAGEGEDLLNSVIAGIESNYSRIKTATIEITKNNDLSFSKSQIKKEIYILNEYYRVDYITSENTASLRFYDGIWWQPFEDASGKRITISPRGEKGLAPSDPRETFFMDTDEKLVEYLQRAQLTNYDIIKEDSMEYIVMTFQLVDKSPGSKVTTLTKKFHFDPTKNFLPVKETQYYEGQEYYVVDYKYKYYDAIEGWFLDEFNQHSKLGTSVNKLTKADFNCDVPISLFELPNPIPEGTFVDDHIRGPYLVGLESNLSSSIRKGHWSKTIIYTIGIVLIVIAVYFKLKRYSKERI
ncbi:MAG: hypothetical protein Q4G68_11035 [Planctomycetia bacterium]|nr:hypothetical protein [Planctomycetia bacterium]